MGTCFNGLQRWHKEEVSKRFQEKQRHLLELRELGFASKCPGQGDVGGGDAGPGEVGGMMAIASLSTTAEMHNKQDNWKE